MNSLYDPNRVQCLNCAEVGFKSLPCQCTQNIWIYWIAVFLFAIALMIFFYSLNYWNVGYGICFILLSIVFLVVGVRARNYRRNQRKKNNFEKPLIMFGLPPQSNQKMSEQQKQETEQPKN